MARTQDGPQDDTTPARPLPLTAVEVESPLVLAEHVVAAQGRLLHTPVPAARQGGGGQ